MVATPWPLTLSCIWHYHWLPLASTSFHLVHGLLTPPYLTVLTSASCVSIHLIQSLHRSSSEHCFPKFFYCCVHNCCYTDVVFTVPEPSNGSLFWLNYSGLQWTSYNIFIQIHRGQSNICYNRSSEIKLLVKLKNTAMFNMTKLMVHKNIVH